MLRSWNGRGIGSGNVRCSPMQALSYQLGPMNNLEAICLMLPEMVVFKYKVAFKE